MLDHLLSTLILAAAQHAAVAGDDRIDAADLLAAEEQYGDGAIQMALRIQRAAREAAALLVSATPRRYRARYSDSLIASYLCRSPVAA